MKDPFFKRSNVYQFKEIDLCFIKENILALFNLQDLKVHFLQSLNANGWYYVKHHAKEIGLRNEGEMKAGTELIWFSKLV